MSKQQSTAAARLSELLARLRAETGLTQEQLAAASGVSVRTIGELEHGRVRRPRGRTIELLAGGLDLNPGQARALIAAARWVPVSRTRGSSGSSAVCPDGMPSGSRSGERRSGLRPRQLPAAPRYFVGRFDALASLNSWLDNATGSPATVVISAIGGTAGVGKSALALVWAHQIAGRFADGQLYVNLRGFDPGGMPAMTAGEALQGFLDALQVPADQIPVETRDQAALYRSVLAGKRMLIVLDNARDAEQVRPLIPASPACAVVVTSRNQLSGLAVTDGANLLNLDVLSPADARHLLERRLGRDRLAAEQDAADELIRLCARLPLALGIAAACAQRAPGLPLAALAGQLRDAGTRLDGFDSDDPVSNFRAVLGCSYSKLPAAVARMFALLGLHPGPDISIPAAASLAGADDRQARHWLSCLTAANMLTEQLTGRYAFHDLIRVYAREQATISMTGTQRQAAVHRLFDHYLHTALDASLLLRPIRPILDPATPGSTAPGVTPERLKTLQDALDWFDADLKVLLAVVALADETGSDAYAWQIPRAMTDYLDWRGHWQDLSATHRFALAAARRLGDPAAHAAVHLMIGQASARLRHEQAHDHLTQALDLYQQLGDHASEAYAHLVLLLVAEPQGRYADALGHAERALTLYQNTYSLAGQAVALNDVGWCRAHLGDHQQASVCCRQALALHRRLGDRRSEAKTWDSLGYTEHMLGRTKSAVFCYQHALRLFRNLSDRFSEASTLTHLGDLHHIAGDPQRARDIWREALAILEDLNHADAAQVRAKLRA